MPIKLISAAMHPLNIVAFSKLKQTRPPQNKSITDNLSYTSEEAWLSNQAKKLICQFTTHHDGLKGELIVMRIFHWHPPDDPIPQGNQKMSRQEALEKWNSLQSHGWKRCSAPPR